MSDPVLIALITGSPGIIAAIFGGLNHYSLQRVKRIQNVVAKNINGRMDQLLESTKIAAIAEGKESERTKKEI